MDNDIVYAILANEKYNNFWNNPDYVGYFTNKEDAKKYCRIKNMKDLLRVHRIQKIECLQNKVNLENIITAWKFRIVFKICDNKSYFEKCDTFNSVYSANYLEPNFLKYEKNYAGCKDNSAIIVEVNLNEYNKPLAEKIAQDIINELAAYGNGRLDLDYIELMNIRFKHQREQENKEKGG